ncbi:MAG TPA: alpha-L-fucosidase [Anaerolineaceae bacterium]
MTMNPVEAIREGARQREGARSDARLNWWREARFGMFIHWGLYAIPAGEWKGQPIPGIGEWIMHRAQIPVAEYEALASQFNPQQFNAADWVSLAKAAGMKYLVITSKHHDGFCLFHSAYTRYNIVDATPFGRDPLKELAAECQKQGIRLGFYYSQTQDWHHPDGFGNTWDYDPAKQDFAAYIENYVKPQVREILTNYGPLVLIWFDTPYAITREQSQSLLDLVHSIQPGCLVNGRLGNNLGDYASSRDNIVPGSQVEADWENPATINDTWGFKKDDHNWKSPTVLIRNLVDIASKGGNYLLNVGPTAEGIIPAPSVERLLAMGEWLKVNGDSIYATQSGPVQGLPWCRTTAKPGKIYLHVFEYPSGGEIRLAGFAQPVQRAYLLSDPDQRNLFFSRSSGGEWVVRAPAQPPDPIDTVIVFETD